MALAVRICSHTGAVHDNCTAVYRFIYAHSYFGVLYVHCMPERTLVWREYFTSMAILMYCMQGYAVHAKAQQCTLVRTLTHTAGKTF